MKIKTIDVQAKEWFDKVNGNSYHGGIVTVNYGLKTEKTFSIPFQYGYGSQYETSARKVLQENGIKLPIADNEGLWNVKDKGILFRSNIQRNCLKRDVIAYSEV